MDSKAIIPSQTRAQSHRLDYRDAGKQTGWLVCCNMNRCGNQLLPVMALYSLPELSEFKQQRIVMVALV